MLLIGASPSYLDQIVSSTTSTKTSRASRNRMVDYFVGSDWSTQYPGCNIINFILGKCKNLQKPHRCPIKRLFWKTCKIHCKNRCAGVFFIKLQVNSWQFYQKSISQRCSLLIFRSFRGRFFIKTPPDHPFY